MDLSALLKPIRASFAAHPATAEGRLRIGAGDATKPATIAALVSGAREPALIVVPKALRARDLVDELTSWLGRDGSRVMLFPERDSLPYERAIEDPWEMRQRLEVIAGLRPGARPVVVASVEAVAQRTLSPEHFRDAVSTVSVGDRLTPDDVLRRLQSSGFEIVPLVEAPGQAARRGGIVDVFAPQAGLPVRIEFFGAEVESIRAFDADTQRSRTRLEFLTIGMAREFTPDSEEARRLLGTLDFEGCSDEAAERVHRGLEAIAAGELANAPPFLTALLSPYSLLGHLPPGATVILDEVQDLSRALDEYVAETATMRIERETRGELPVGLPPAQANWGDLQPLMAGHDVIELSRFATEEAGAIRPPFSAASGYGGRVRVLARDLQEAVRRGVSVAIVSQQASRLATILQDEGVASRAVEDRLDAPAAGVVQIMKGSVPHGWHLGGDDPQLLLTDAEVFGFVKQRRAMRPAGPDRSGLIADLTPGDYVVHIEHGIARFAGMATRTLDGVSREFLELQYAEGDRLFVPVDQADRVARYVGPGEHRPGLTRLGSGEWGRTRDRVRRAVAEIAKDLLELYASREVIEGHAFSPDTPWQQELEASFPYVETPDQLEAIHAVKVDMESAQPMDRLICGDVGYGKTEVAIRAAFKAVVDGYQVAILVPTTVLAQQHYNTFRERLASLPCRVEMLSRFRSEREARSIVAGLAEGSVDIIIGTHRLLQNDVQIKKLGLVIIDEEQRFGVAHKERLKLMRQQVDVLTLSATPIPRTLHMSLIGIRDMSNMVTPPEDRFPIRTYVMESDDNLIHEAITRELERGGQVFFVHNRVYNIEMIAARIRKLAPDAAIGIGHGQMDEHQLEATMLQFAAGEIDVLVCTTIIESGLDIPNANTIIINHADKLGLAQLYQLRGRVGRGPVRAYAYLLYERNTALSETAQRRLQAIFEATELGAGMQIALKDLEIRGAGNLLGAEQSGFMASVGFDLYVRLLGEAVERVKAIQRGETPPEPILGRPAMPIDLPLTAYLPEAYMPDLNLRLALYQRLSRAGTNGDVDAMEQEIKDRFGEAPVPAKNLLWVVRLRLLATDSGIAAIQTEGNQLVIRLLGGRRIDREVFPRRLAGVASLTPHQLRLDLVALGEGWREGLVRALAALGTATVREA